VLRVACNRDELVTRAAALPPVRLTAGNRQAVMPLDPQSGGTWIAVNDAGIVFALLNATPVTPSSLTPSPVSRGTIIPGLVGCATVAEALARAAALRADRFQPFKLLLFDRYQLVECWPDAGRLRHRRSFLSGAVMRTSSGLGDAIVAGPRRTLFRRVFEEPIDPRCAQDLFHQHRWPGHEAISVNMDRSGARTVSHTVIEIGLETIAVSYRATEAAQPVVVQVAAAALLNQTTRPRADAIASARILRSAGAADQRSDPRRPGPTPGIFKRMR
jgi:hypothetical protein